MCTFVPSRFSRVRLCDPMDCSPPGSSVHGILQGRILGWLAMPSSRSSPPRDRTPLSCLLRLQVSSLPLAPPGKSYMLNTYTHTHTHIYINDMLIYVCTHTHTHIHISDMLIFGAHGLNKLLNLVCFLFHFFVMWWHTWVIFIFLLDEIVLERRLIVFNSCWGQTTLSFFSYFLLYWSSFKVTNLQCFPPGYSYSLTKST